MAQKMRWNEGWGHGLQGRMPVLQAWNPEFKTPGLPNKKKKGKKWYY
jgi:hypothetical protein